MPKPFAQRHASLFAALAAIATPALAQESILRTTPTEAAVDAVFKRYDSKDTPGCSVAVIDAGKVLLKKSYGMADVSLGVPRTSATSHWIPYSEARVFVALAVAMLERDGKISWSEPIRKHVPEVPEYASAVTVRQLLHHTSGLADYGVLEPAAKTEDRVSEDELFRVLRKWNKLGFAPGSGKMYSNTDYALLKILVERSTGGSLHDYLHDRLLKPLGMTSTRIGANQGDPFPGHALFHYQGDKGSHRVLQYRTNPVGQIAVTTNLDDLIRWEHALGSNAHSIRDLLTGMESGAQPHTSSYLKRDGFTFGVYRLTHRGLPMKVYHGVEEYAYLVQVPGTRLSVATLCNANLGMHSMGLDVARLYAAPAAWTAPPKRTTGPAVDLPEAELGRYVGEYRDPRAREFVDVVVRDGKLRADPRGSTPFPSLTAHGNGQFTAVIKDWALTLLLEFKEENGEMMLVPWDMTHDETGGTTLQRWTPWKPDATVLKDYDGTYVGDEVEATLHVRTDGKRVLVASHNATETALNPWDKPDHFAGPDIYTSRFERDASGRVTALVLDAERIKGMRYTKQK